MGTRAKIEGKSFGKLTVLSFSHFHQTRNHMSVWNCLCICKKECKVAIAELRNGDTVSCGCFRKEIVRPMKHGLMEHPLYQVWADLKYRCSNSKAANYSDYGGRGIMVCEEWNDFMPFYNWSLANGYKKGLEIDRYPNNDGNYEPLNCRWATRKQNANNTRRTLYAEINGVKKTASEWAHETGVNHKCISHRIRTGCTGKEAVYGKPRAKKYVV